MQHLNCNKFSLAVSVTIMEAIVFESLWKCFITLERSVLSLVERAKFRRILDVNYSLLANIRTRIHSSLVILPPLCALDEGCYDQRPSSVCTTDPVINFGFVGGMQPYFPIPRRRRDEKKLVWYWRYSSAVNCALIYHDEIGGYCNVILGLIYVSARRRQDFLKNAWQGGNKNICSADQLVISRNGYRSALTAATANWWIFTLAENLLAAAINQRTFTRSRDLGIPFTFG